jgi:hypothetical protein
MPEHKPGFDPLDATLDLQFSADNCSCQRIPQPPGTAYLFSGVRANVGLLSGGKCYFKVHIGQPLPVEVQSREGLKTSFQARIGISRLDIPVGHLGEVQPRFVLLLLHLQRGLQALERTSCSARCRQSTPGRTAAAARSSAWMGSSRMPSLSGPATSSPCSLTCRR